MPPSSTDTSPFHQKMHALLTYRGVCNYQWGRLWCDWGTIWRRLTEHAPGVTIWTWNPPQCPRCRLEQSDDSAVEIGDEERKETTGSAEVRKNTSQTLCIDVFRLVKTHIWSMFVCLVRFSLNSELNLKTALINMGLGDIFNLATADFSRMTCKLITH